MRFLRTIAASLIALTMLVRLAMAPAAASINPTFRYAVTSPFASPTGMRLVIGSITFSPGDTYTAGGFQLTPKMLGFPVALTSLAFGSSTQTWSPVVTITTNGMANVSFFQLTETPAVGWQYGQGVIAATATTAVVNVTSLTTTTPIICTLDNTGSGTGTWAVTTAVSTCNYTSPTTFTITVTAAAPTGGGNFNYFLPTQTAMGVTPSMVEMATGTDLSNVTLFFAATGM